MCVGGGRKYAARFRYTSNSTSVFVELAPTHTPKAKELFAWLEAGESVARAEWQSSKAAQGNSGRHESEQNLKVYPTDESTGSATQE